MLSSLLGALLLFIPVTHDFNGLKLEVLTAPNAPVTAKQTTSWEGNYAAEVLGEKSTVVVYHVVVTDLKSFPQKPTEEELLRFHERAARTRKPFAAQNFRRTMAKIGEQQLLVLSGSVLAPNSAGQPKNSYWVSCALMAGDQAYEFTQVTFFENHHQDALQRLSKMSVVVGDKTLKATGVPQDLKGDYSIVGLPFVVNTSITPFVSTVTANDSAFGAQYTALMTRVVGPSHFYKVREVKADDKRTDAELFRHLVIEQVGTDTATPLELTVKDGSGAADVEYKRNNQEFVAHLRFERE
ncbi:MAG: hypothetical protein ACO1SX_18725, partial [Actinomycetota bacterium]